MHILLMVLLIFSFLFFSFLFFKTLLIIKRKKIINYILKIPFLLLKKKKKEKTTMNYDLDFQPYTINNYWINIFQQYLELYFNSKFKRKFQPFSQSMINVLYKYYKDKKNINILQKMIDIELALKNDWGDINSIILNSNINTEIYKKNYISIRLIYKIAYPKKEISEHKDLPIQISVKPTSEYVFRLLFVYLSIYILDKSILLDVYIQTIRDKFNKFDVPNFWKTTFDLNFNSGNNLGFDLKLDWKKIYIISEKLISYKLFEIKKFKSMFEIFFENLKKKKINLQEFSTEKNLEIFIYNSIFEKIPIITENNLQTEIQKIQKLVYKKIILHDELIEKSSSLTKRINRGKKNWENEDKEEKLKVCTEFIKNLEIISIHNEIMWNNNYISVVSKEPNILYKYSYIYVSKDLSYAYYFDKTKNVKERIDILGTELYFKCFAIFMIHLGLDFEEYKILFNFLKENYLKYLFPSFIEFVKNFKI